MCPWHRNRKWKLATASNSRGATKHSCGSAKKGTASFGTTATTSISFRGWTRLRSVNMSTSPLTVLGAAPQAHCAQGTTTGTSSSSPSPRSERHTQRTRARHVRSGHFYAPFIAIPTGYLPTCPTVAMQHLCALHALA